jgi:hypothetical protein
MVYAWELIVENALKVFPLEASVKPKRSSEGVPLVVVPQYPASPSTVDPLMFRSREIPHNAPGVALTVAGDVGKLNLRFDKGDGLKILDPVSSDLLQSHIDFVFEFRSAIVDVARYDQQGSRLPPEFVADHVADYLDSWLTSNPYAVISAIVAAGARRAQDDPVDRGFFVASGDQRPVGIVDGFADPRYGEFAIDGFTVAQYSELLKEINEGFVLRWRREANNPFLVWSSYVHDLPGPQ